MLTDLAWANSSQLVALGVTIGIVGTTLWLMMLMWRQMRRVNARGAERSREVVESEPQPYVPKFEEYDPVSGTYGARAEDVNEGLLRQGAKAREPGWYMDR